MDFGKNLASIRKKKGFSQEELAFAADISRQTLYTWEASLAYPNVMDLQKLAKALGVESGVLLNGCAIDRFPKKLFPYYLSKISDDARDFDMEELTGWFIVPKPNEEVSWAMYDMPSGKRDYSYHLVVRGAIELHQEKGYEIGVEEYNPEGLLIEEGKRTFYAQLKNGMRRYLGMESSEKGRKVFSDFLDESFKKFWGGKEKTAVTTIGVYELALPERKIELYRLPLYEEGNFLIDQYVNGEGRTVLWKRYKTDGKKSKDFLKNGKKTFYYDYECWTDRIFS
jgi:transcriptional regulator with XRE-family HTH domain